MMVSVTYLGDTVPDTNTLPYCNISELYANAAARIRCAVIGEGEHAESLARRVGPETIQLSPRDATIEDNDLRARAERMGAQLIFTVLA